MSLLRKQNLEDTVIADCCGLAMAIVTRRQNLALDSPLVDADLRGNIIASIDSAEESIRMLRESMA